MRIPCTLVQGGARRGGVVLDVSRDGLFVRTTLLPPPGSVLELELHATAISPAMTLEVEVARSFRVPARLLAHAAGGVGLHVRKAPLEFAALAAAPAGRRRTPRPQAPPTPRTRAAAGARYAVRLQARQGNRSRTLQVDAADAAGARQAALARVGAGWDVLEVNPAR